MTGNEVLICFGVAFFQTVIYILFCGKKEKIFCLKKAFIYEATEKSDLEKSDSENDINTSVVKQTLVYKTWQSWVFICSAIVVFLLTSFFLFENINGWYNFFKLSMLTMIITTAGTIDLKTKRIPNDLVLLGLAFRLIIYVFEIINCSEEILDIFKNDMIGFAIGFGILFLAAIISRGSVGFGDVKLFAVIGLCGGAILTYSTLLIALIVNTIFSLAIIFIKKKDRKTAVPFGPAIFIGYLCALCLSSF